MGRRASWCLLVSLALSAACGQAGDSSGSGALGRAGDRAAGQQDGPGDVSYATWVQAVAKYPADFEVTILAGAAAGSPLGTSPATANGTVIDPSGPVVVDAAGRVFFVEEYGQPSSRLRMVDPASNTMVTVDGLSGTIIAALSTDASNLAVLTRSGTAWRIETLHVNGQGGGQLNTVVNLPVSSTPYAWTSMVKDANSSRYYVTRFRPEDVGEFFTGCEVVSVLPDPDHDPDHATFTVIAGNGDCDSTHDTPNPMTLQEDGTAVPLSFPWGLAVSGDGELLFVTDLGHRRILAYNAGGDTTFRGAPLSAGYVRTVAGDGPDFPGHAGDPATTFALCSPMAMLVAGDTLAWSDSCYDETTPQARASFMFAEIPLGRVKASTTARLTKDYSTYQLGAPPATTPTGPGNLALGEVAGVGYDSRPDHHVFYVADAYANRVYAIAFHDREAEVEFR